jgi:hypothetical protein
VSRDAAWWGDREAEANRRRLREFADKRDADVAKRRRDEELRRELVGHHRRAQWLREELSKSLREVVDASSEIGGSPREVCLSNRKTNLALSALTDTASISERWLAARGVGVDRVSVAFPLAARQADPTAWDSVRVSHGVQGRSERFEASVELSEGVRAYVGAQEIPDANPPWWGKVELNPSRVLDPEGWGLASVGDAIAVVDDVVGSLGELVRPRSGPEEWLVKRIDVARDFVGIEGSAIVVNGLGPIKRPWARRNLVHADPGRNGAQTLMVGSGAGVVRLYDKAAESRGKAPDGTLRWECEARARWLGRYASVRAWSELGPSGLQALVRDRWEWSAMGVGVSDDLSDVVERLEGSGLSPREQAGYLGWLVMRSAGRPWVPGSHHTEDKYRRVERESGISFARLVETAGVTRRLDFDRGELVREVA